MQVCAFNFHAGRDPELDLEDLVGRRLVAKLLEPIALSATEILPGFSKAIADLARDWSTNLICPAFRAALGSDVHDAEWTELWCSYEVDGGLAQLEV